MRKPWLSNRGQYDEAERLYRSGLEICRAVPDPQGIAVFLLRLGQLALDRGYPDEALPLLQEARQGFISLQLYNWVADVDSLLAVAQVEGLIDMIGSALQGDQQAGQQAWEICENLAQATDAAQAALGRGLQRVLAGESPDDALVALPDDLRAHILEGLNNNALIDK